MTGCSFISTHSSSSRGPSLCRIESGIPTLPMSCRRAAVSTRCDLVRVKRQRLRDAHGQLDDRLGVVAGVAVALEQGGGQADDRVAARVVLRADVVEPVAHHHRASAAVDAGAVDAAARDLEQLLGRLLTLPAGDAGRGGDAADRAGGCGLELEQDPVDALLRAGGVGVGHKEHELVSLGARDEVVRARQLRDHSAGGAEDRVAYGVARARRSARGNRRCRARRPRAGGRAGASDRPRRRGADGSGAGRGGPSGHPGRSACRARARARRAAGGRRSAAARAAVAAGRYCRTRRNDRQKRRFTALYSPAGWTPFGPSPPTIRAASRRPPAGRPSWGRRRR